MSKISLVTKNHGIVTLDGDDVLTNNVVLPHQYNPHNVQLFVIGHEHGAFVALWASHEQEAFDEMLDHNYEQFLIDPADYEKMTEEEQEECAHLGNAGEPCSLDYAWIDEVIIDPSTKDGLNLLLSFAVAIERQDDNLSNVEYN